MPPTAGVLRFAQYLKNRNPTQTSVTSAVPPSSQRKRVAAVQDKKSTTVRLPLSPPRPNTKGTVGFIAPYILTTFLYHGIIYPISRHFSMDFKLVGSIFMIHIFIHFCTVVVCTYIYRCWGSSSSPCREGWAMCRNQGI